MSQTLECAFNLYFKIFLSSQTDCKLEFLNFTVGWICQFFPIHGKEERNFDFQMFFNGLSLPHDWHLWILVWSGRSNFHSSQKIENLDFWISLGCTSKFFLAAYTISCFRIFILQLFQSQSWVCLIGETFTHWRSKWDLQPLLQTTGCSGNSNVW